MAVFGHILKVIKADIIDHDQIMVCVIGFDEDVATAHILALERWNVGQYLGFVPVSVIGDFVLVIEHHTDAK